MATSSQSNVDLFLTYQALQRLATPFGQWPACRLGIIDSQGKVLKKHEDLKTQAEMNAWGYFDILCANIKKIIARYPQYQSKMGPLSVFGPSLPPAPASSIGTITNYPLSYVASLLFLLKDSVEDPNDIPIIESRLEHYFNQLVEDGGAVAGAPTNSMGGGQIAGGGIGPSGEPGIMPNKTKYKKHNENAGRKLLAHLRDLGV